MDVLVFDSVRAPLAVRGVRLDNGPVRGIMSREDHEWRERMGGFVKYFH